LVIVFALVGDSTITSVVPFIPTVSIHLLTYFVVVLLVLADDDVVVFEDFAFPPLGDLLLLVVVFFVVPFAFVVAILYNKKICNDVRPTIIKVILNANKKKDRNSITL
jgi:hypothetical protein